MVISSEISWLVIEIGRSTEYATNFYYDTAKTVKEAAVRMGRLAEKGYEVIGVITETEATDTLLGFEKKTVKVEFGEVTVFKKTTQGKKWGEATEKLLHLLGRE